VTITAKLLGAGLDHHGGARGAQRVIRLIAERLEDRQDAVAGEPLDHAAFPVHDRWHDGRPVGIQHRDDLRGVVSLAERGEADGVGEQRGDLPLPTAEVAEARLTVELVRELRPEVPM
jgi:hypothetical protein